MIRIGAIVWLIFIALLGIGVFQMKYSVQAQEKELRKIRADITQNLQAIHILKAEWSYLNDPTRLGELARRHTDLAPITTSQVIDISTLPLALLDTDPAPEGERKAHQLPLIASQKAQHYSDKDRQSIQEIMARMAQ